MNEDTLAWIVGSGQTLLLGILLLFVPRVTRRGLLFGVYVGETAAGSATARRITRRWTGQMMIALIVTFGISFAIGWLFNPGAGVGSSTALLIAAFFGTYILAHRQARPLASTTAAQRSIGSLSPRPADSVLYPVLVLAIAIIMGMFSLAYAAAHYTELPGQVPIHFGPTGEPDRWVDKSVVSVFFVPAANLILSTAMAGTALLIATAKRSLRREQQGVSLAAQQRFHRTLSGAFCCVALLFSTLLTVGSVSTIHVGLGQSQRLHWMTLISAAGASVLIIGAIGYIVWRVGQGGGKLERAVDDAPLVGGLAGNQHWILGLIYVNRDDPSILIEHRFGIGYTINFGNWRAVAILVGFLALVGMLVLIPALVL